jgi:deoxyribose-phosphate aldolase
LTDDVALARRAIALLDLTELGDNATVADVEALCAKAVGRGAVPPVAAVCVWPRHVNEARLRLPAAIRVATVVNFPTGDAPVTAVLAEVEQALTWGAEEIDLVIPYKAVLAGNTAPAVAMTAAVKAMLPSHVPLKVIFESGVYPDAATLSGIAAPVVVAGADFLKTSTGKVPQGATLEAAQIFLEQIRIAGRPVGLKPSGGIRTLADARAYLGLADALMGPEWATPRSFRFGASGLWDALAAVIEGRDRIASTGY